LITKRSHGDLIVVEDDVPVGIITEADCENVYLFTQLNKIMSKDFITLVFEMKEEGYLLLLEFIC
jgi:IMP dehydrogenase